jgi:superfamily II RNA helicase
MATSLYDQLLRVADPSADRLLGRFLDYVAAKGLTLYPAQEEALLALFEGRNVILNTPTGSGKSLVALALVFAALARGRRAVWTCPIKALVNEKWRDLCREFGPDNVGLSTGDATVNRDAPVLCCTAEILANIALRHGADAPVDDAVLDEFHWYADRERGVAWQVPLLTLARTRFLLMSATLGETEFFEQALTRLTGRATVAVKSAERPVPLEFSWSEIPLAQTLERLVAEGKAPVYVVHFTQADAAQSAQDFTSLNVCTREEKNRIAAQIEGFQFNSPYGPEIRKWVKHGIGIHHAGLLPKYRVLIERLAQEGLLKIICGTDTLGVGVNVPIRTVLFTRLCKFDGQKTAILSARDFHQISGRAGRKGFDDKGWVVAQAPEHVIENLKLEEKAARDGKKVVKRRPPDHNFVSWDLKTFQRLIASPPERLVSRFQVSHAMLLHVLSREGDGCRAMRQLIRDCHDSPRQKREHFKRAWQLFRSLVERKIIEILPPEERGAQAPRLPVDAPPRQPAAADAAAHGPQDEVPQPTAGAPLAARGARALPKLRVNVDLQEDFSMDQTLSLYLLETIPLLNPEQEDYALVVLSLVEAILEDPDLILRKQLDKVKAQAVAQWKAEGVPYEERMARLEELEYPKPNRDFIYSTFNAFADRHPWVGQENIRPKSIAREMFETFRSFADYVRDYELQRAEGLLLRHLNSVYKVLRQTVPETAKNDQLREMELYLGTMIRAVDSSLLDEWEQMRDPDYERRVAAERAKIAGVELKPPGAEEAAADLTRDPKAFTAAIRNRIFTFLRALANREFEAAVQALEAAPVSKPAGSPTSQSAGAAESGALEKHATTAGLETRETADLEICATAQPWTPERLRQAMDAYLAEHERLLLTPEARNQRHTYITPSEDRRTWRVQQMLVDPEGHNDWVAEFEVDLAASRAGGEPVLRLLRLGPLVHPT